MWACWGEKKSWILGATKHGSLKSSSVLFSDLFDCLHLWYLEPKLGGQILRRISDHYSMVDTINGHFTLLHMCKCHLNLELEESLINPRYFLDLQVHMDHKIKCQVSPKLQSSWLSIEKYPSVVPNKMLFHVSPTSCHGWMETGLQAAMYHWIMATWLVPIYIYRYGTTARIWPQN